MRESLLTPDSLVTMKYITSESQMSEQWFYRLIKQGKFPPPIKLGRSSRWKLSDFTEWAARQESASRL